MLKQHKNVLFEVIRNSRVPLLGRIESLNEDDHIIDDDLGFARDDCFVIHILDTPLSFWVWPDPNRPDAYHFRFTILWANFPFNPWQVERQAQSDTRGRRYYTRPYSIEDVARELERWINGVVSQYFIEEGIGDYWEELKQYQSFISDSTFTEEDLQPFSSKEKAQIRTSLQDFQLLVVENHNPNAEQLEFIIERLEYLSDAVDRLNRFDWKGVALSTVIGIATNLGIDTTSGAALIHLLQQAFQRVRLFLP